MQHCPFAIVAKRANKQTTESTSKYLRESGEVVLSFYRDNIPRQKQCNHPQTRQQTIRRNLLEKFMQQLLYFV